MANFKHQLCIAILGLSLLQIPAALADNDRPIRVEQLPVPAQTLLKQHFSDFKVVLAEVENGPHNKSYEVKFKNGGSIEFDKKGNWTEIDCKNKAVPAKFVPQRIAKYVKATWPGEKIVKIEKDRKRFEIELSSGKEISFDKNFNVTDIDD